MSILLYCPVILQIDDNDQYLKPLDTLIKRICNKFPVPLHYERIRDRASDSGRRVENHGFQATFSHKNTSITEGHSETSVEDFFVDVTPGPALDTISCVTEIPEKMNVDDESIPFNLTEKSTNQLYENYINNLLYIAPKFSQMQKNSNKQRKKKH